MKYTYRFHILVVVFFLHQRATAHARLKMMYGIQILLANILKVVSSGHVCIYEFKYLPVQCKAWVHIFLIYSAYTYKYVSPSVCGYDLWHSL